MPAPMNDNTFFILYALTKCPILNIESLSLLFKGWKIEKIFKEFDTLLKCGVKIGLNFYPNTDASIEELEKIEQYKEDIINVIDNPQTINDCSAVVKKLLPYCIADISCSAEPDKIKEKIDEYLTKSTEDRKKYFCTIDEHAEVFKKVKKWAINIQDTPYKIGINRFLERTGEKNNNSKFAFFHFLYEQEKKKTVSISELGFSDDKPHIVFENLKGKIHKPKVVKPIGNELAHFGTIQLYENGILNGIKPDNFCPCEDLEIEVFKLFFKNPYDVPYSDIASVLGIKEKEVSKRIYKNRKKIKKVSTSEDTKYFYNDQKNKTYSLIFQKK